MMRTKSILFVLAAGLWTNTMSACSSQLDDSYSGMNSTTTVEDGAPVYQATPTAYRSACAQAGTIETFNYTAHDDNGNAYSKQCRVYLPFGYDSNKPYDVLYLMHGYGGNIRTIFEGTVGLGICFSTTWLISAPSSQLAVPVGHWHTKLVLMLPTQRQNC